MSRAFCSTDQEKRETARSLIWNDGRGGIVWQQEELAMGLSATLRVFACIDPRQFWTIPNSCTTHASISMTHNWYAGTDGNGATE